MIDTKTIGMAWKLLDQREQRNFSIVLAIVLVAAIGTVLMVASIMPFLSVLSNPERIENNWLLQRAYELGGFDDAFEFLFALGLASIGVILFANAIQFLKVYAIVRFASLRTHSISTRLLKNYLAQPYLFFLDHHSGELGKQLLSESETVVNRFIKPALEAISASVTLIMLVIMLLFLEPVISIAAFATIGAIYGLIITATRKWTRRLGETRAATNSDRYRIANEALGGVKDIKILGREQDYVNRYTKPSLQFAQSQARITFLGQSPQYVIHAAMLTGVISICLFLIAKSGLEGQAALQDLVPTIGLIAFSGQRMLPELSRLFQSITQLSYSGPAVEAVNKDLVRTAPSVTLPTKRPRPLGLKTSLEFENVSFQYPSADKAGLFDVSFSISAGERIGIVGSTGAGKSTLANLVLGLFKQDQGRVLVDGKFLEDADRRAWQLSIGYVPQDIFLADQTILENIALGVPKDKIDLESVYAAATVAHVHEFILTELDSGYDTVVGERGVRLSGGQRQRIGIARALYNQADLVLFDEATSALDNATEKDVMRSIDSLPGDKTLIMIAHRLSTLRGCDRILVLKQGRIAGFDSWVNLENDCEEFRAIAAGALLGAQTQIEERHLP